MNAAQFNALLCIMLAIVAVVGGLAIRSLEKRLAALDEWSRSVYRANAQQVRKPADAAGAMTRVFRRG